MKLRYWLAPAAATLVIVVQIGIGEQMINLATQSPGDIALSEAFAERTPTMPWAEELRDSGTMDSEAAIAYLRSEIAHEEKTEARLRSTLQAAIDQKVWLPGIHQHYASRLESLTRVTPPVESVVLARSTVYARVACERRAEGLTDEQILDGVLDESHTDEFLALIPEVVAYSLANCPVPAT